MRVIRGIKQMSGFSKKVRLGQKSIGFVPTMGALHEGHISLIRQARKENDIVAVSIFVNPAQFGPKEDLKIYPRNLKQDAGLCKEAGVDIIFYPKDKDMYPQGYKTYIEVKELSGVLCGKFRPGHFKGVVTIVTKLFNIVNPNIAYFGQKDAQQAIIIKRMACDLNMPVRIKVVPTVREKDGLAMSSRNLYLSQNEREDATVLYKALNKAKDLIREGNKNAQNIISKMKRIINTAKTVRIEYISIVDLENLRPVKVIKDKVLIALAAWIGKTRLIDNITIKAK